MNTILSCSCTCHPEPLAKPFGFKGGALTELWQVVCRLRDSEGHTAAGMGVQSVLWSDEGIFAGMGQEKGNRLMLNLTEYALTLLKDRPLRRPDLMMRELIPQVYEYARRESGYERLRLTFVLNALTPVDWALWQLYARSQDCFRLTRLAAPITSAFTEHQPLLGNIPLVSYGTSREEIRRLAEEGTFLYKIKIGSAFGGSGNMESMLEWDCQRLLEIHRLVSEETTPYTECGHPVYYLDANGRYDTPERVKQLLSFASKHHILDRIILLEEPFAEDNLQDVRSLPVRIVGDESAHGGEDARRLTEEYGYSAIALKPAAKTLSVTLEVLEIASRRGIPCFCADLTVNPAMTEYNKALAARLPLLPGLKCGVMESNGAQNYLHWDRMLKEDPAAGESWALPEKGLYRLDKRFFQYDGGIWLSGSLSRPESDAGKAEKPAG